jgi:hypothetical protein
MAKGVDAARKLSVSSVMRPSASALAMMKQRQWARREDGQSRPSLPGLASAYGPAAQQTFGGVQRAGER